jgi:lipoyl synthase
MSESLVQLTPRERLPDWIRMGLPREQYPRVHDLLRRRGLVTVCREARCPNLTECWSAGTATLMLLGDTCTRRCSFCAVTTHSPGGEVDRSEPARVAEAVKEWDLRYVVLTQVCRDDLEDQGASLLAETVRAVHASSPGTRVEVLAGDLGGDGGSLETLLSAGPEVFAHNVETVRRLTPEVRDRRAGYDRSLEVLRAAKRGPHAARVTKSSVMLGLGEEKREVEECLRDLRSAGVDLVTLGQYLRPGGAKFHPVARYPPPEEFEEWARLATELGFSGVASGPMVRSSYRADELYLRALSGGS